MDTIVQFRTEVLIELRRMYEALANTPGSLSAVEAVQAMSEHFSTRPNISDAYNPYDLRTWDYFKLTPFERQQPIVATSMPGRLSAPLHRAKLNTLGRLLLVDALTIMRSFHIGPRRLAKIGGWLYEQGWSLRLPIPPHSPGCQELSLFPQVPVILPQNQVSLAPIGWLMPPGMPVNLSLLYAVNALTKTLGEKATIGELAAMTRGQVHALNCVPSDRADAFADRVERLLTRIGLSFAAE